MYGHELNDLKALYPQSRRDFSPVKRKMGGKAKGMHSRMKNNAGLKIAMCAT
jgi:hypothetical protein